MKLDSRNEQGINRDRLSQDVRFPEDCIHVLRSRPFRFAARSCNEWFHGRVVLCGDAAHVFPPCIPHLSIYPILSKLISIYNSRRPRHSLRLPRRHLPILASSPPHPHLIPHLSSQSPKSPTIMDPRAQATTNPLPLRHNFQRQLRNRTQPAQDLPSRLVPLHSLIYTTLPAEYEARAQEGGDDSV